MNSKTMAHAAAPLVAFCLVWITPVAALAQLGSLMVTITSPKSGDTVSGTITVSARVTNIGSLTVRGVQFKLDGDNLAEDTSEPYSVSWDTTTASNGSHTLTAVARDLLGVQWTSDPVTVTVSNDSTASDTTPPTVAITSPTSGSTVSGTIPVRASASDNVGVAGVSFFVDSSNAIGVEDTTSPYEVSWDTTTVADGSHTLTAVARDTSGNTGTSTINVTVANGSTTPPPTAGCPQTVNLAAFPGSTLFNNTVRSQMWIDGSTWWGVFSDASSGIFFYRLDRSGNRFVKGDFIDGNASAGKPDALWNGRELFIMVYQSGSLARLYKYTSSSSTGYSLVAGFPVDVTLPGGLALAVALHQDGTGKLWAAYTSGSDVRVIWSTSADHRVWDTTGVILASDISTSTPEAATIMHFGGSKIGVVWSNQARGEIGFRFHVDGALETSWSTKEIVDCCEGIPGVADDHLSLRADNGRLFLVAKDGIGNGRIHYYVRSTAGTWGQKTIVDPDPTAQPTRQNLVLDTTNQHAYVIYHNSTDKQMYFARTSMSSPAFEERCVFTSQGNNVTSTKQNVTETSDLVAASSTSSSGQIFSGLVD